MAEPVVLDVKNKRLAVGSRVERRSTKERFVVSGFGKPEQELIRIDLERGGEPYGMFWGEEMMNGKFRGRKVNEREGEAT